MIGDMRKKAEIRRVLSCGELAGMFGVDPRTVNRWKRNGKLAGLTIIRTPGGHLRFYEDEVLGLLARMQQR